MASPMVDESAARAAVPDGTPRRTSARRVRRWLGASLAAIVLFGGLLLALLFWALHNATGSAWLVTLLPQLKIVAPKGSLLGDFAAARIDITLPGSSGVLRLDAPRWHALHAARGDHGRWLHLRIDTLHADRVTLLRSDKPAPAVAEPASPPRTLRLPVEIEIHEASVDELRFGAREDAPTLHALRGRIHLGAAFGHARGAIARRASRCPTVCHMAARRAARVHASARSLRLRERRTGDSAQRPGDPEGERHRAAGRRLHRVAQRTRRPLERGPVAGAAASSRAARPPR